ncbi:tensin-1-like isoform X3 [Watersipora subatra]|uniref:tensin-1-like isoform X3 n=1 Tax=Watersipora subatra TaxID=2589382 RepID=UPI00355B3B95
MPSSTMATHTIPSHEQHELDEVLRELLGDPQNSPPHYSPRRNRSSTRASESGSSCKGSATDSTGYDWLAQQQRKLSQRQQSREVEDISQRHRQQKQLVSELKRVQTRRKESMDDRDFNANVVYPRVGAYEGIYRSEAEVPVTSQEPEAYTVFIKPEELKRIEEDKKTTVTQRSLTNVSHTHHNHYNFHDSTDEVFESNMRSIMEDQKRRIEQLEDELRKVKMGLEQTPARPQRVEVEEEEEEYSFKPVGIASLESGTGLPVAIQSAPVTPSTPQTPTFPDATSTPTFNLSNPAQAEIQSNTLPSERGHSHTLSSHRTFSSKNLSPQTNQIPQTPTGRQQRIVTEEMHHQQHIYQPPAAAHTGTEPSQKSTMSQMMRQQSASYSFPNPDSSAATVGNGTLPLNNALHVNTLGSQANSGVTYATIGAGSASPSGRLQAQNNSSGSLSQDQSQSSAKFVKDTSKYWYKSNITRDEVISLLKNSSPGTFIVRDSNSFPGAFGLAVKVHQLPGNVQVKPGADPAAEYVRFYLIEPTPKGVKLKGCPNEPVFPSLASLIYQHTITPLALPCKLSLPDPDQYQLNKQSPDEPDGPALSNRISSGSEIFSTAADLLQRGAACHVIYMNEVDTESLTGPQAISRAVHQTFSKEVLETTVATFKVSAEGITITDNNRKVFFRKHFPKDSISYCGVDSADRRFTQTLENADIQEAKIFGFVAKRKGGNQCLLFAELDPEQPASAIANFVTKVLLGKK